MIWNIPEYSHWKVVLERYCIIMWRSRNLRCSLRWVSFGKCHTSLLPVWPWCSHPDRTLSASSVCNVTLVLEMKPIQQNLKVSFNNVFTFKNLSYMSLHAISVFDKVYKWSPEKNCTSKAPLSASKKVKICKWPKIPYSFLPIDCCVRINGQPHRLFSGDIQS